ncbi:MobF family relaxase [Oleomonas cavernae]|nr:MobF family relaxase [Oleomonas cavernae]
MVIKLHKPASAGYYLESSYQYYGAGQEPPGYWIAFGPTADSLGIRSGDLVEASHFESILQGFRPDSGEALGELRADRNIGYDLVCAAPKSVAVLDAIAPPSIRNEIAAAQATAVHEAMELVINRSASSRRGHNGRGESVQASIVAAAFPQHDARPPAGQSIGDPHLHTHVVIANVSVGMMNAGERWTALACTSTPRKRPPSTTWHWLEN